MAWQLSMMEMVNYLLSHPIALMFMAVALLLMVYFFLKQLLRLALVCGFVLIGIGGYYYFKAPSEFPAKAEKAVEEITNKTQGVFEQGKKALDKSRELTKTIAETAKKEQKQFSDE